MKIILFSSGGVDHYQMGLLEGLLKAGLTVEVVGNDRLDDYRDLFARYPRAIAVNLRGGFRPDVSIPQKIMRLLRSYGRVLRYPFQTDATVVHLQWLIRFPKFDRIFLPLVFRLAGKKVVVTAHEIDPEARHNRSGPINRLSLRIYYALAQKIIVHTGLMQAQLMQWFAVGGEKIHVLGMGLNEPLFNPDLTRGEARDRLGLGQEKKIFLFFGMITWFKGVDILLEAFAGVGQDCHLVIAGRSATGADAYVAQLQRQIDTVALQNRVSLHLRFIPDAQISFYFTAADCLVLPYRNLYQSAVLFMGLTFGLPVITTDVGALKEWVEDGVNGWVCRAGDSGDLAEKLCLFLQSDLCEHSQRHRLRIRQQARESYSWEAIGAQTSAIYREM
ncbi:MAG TPA: glycosyltransferase family 4 protein [Magnetococcales bacterium]|nr:glycosyltransferase family 4 protein [Magnetococcales bacterium]